MTHSVLKKWDVLQILNKDFVTIINIFGRNGKQVIIITNDDNVFSFGDNDSYGCLALGHKNAVQEPSKIEELCAKNVKQIEFGIQFNFALALTKNGRLYSWGYNGDGGLGIGNTTSKSKPKIISALSKKLIIDIKCGYNHSLALTSRGYVYIWGYHIGNSPTKICFEATNQKIISISSGQSHALAISNNYDVYYWGSNSLGQCGSGRSNNFKVAKWCKLQEISDLYATKVVCGPNHSMILSTKGMVYCLGDNRFGQCGDGTNVNKNIPTKVNINVKFKDITATNQYNISVGISDNGFCYIWGQCGLNSFNKPNQIQSNSIYDVLQHYSINKVTFNPLIINEKPYEKSIMDRIANKFNKREYSDIGFKVENKYIYAQKAHLINVCNYFESMFVDKKWAESSKSEIEIQNYSYDVYYAFIKYLYTDCVDICGDKTIELMDLANYYLDEILKQRCLDLIKNLIKNENVFAIYFSAVKYNSDELKAYCLEYINADKSNLNVILDNAVKFCEI